MNTLEPTHDLPTPPNHDLTLEIVIVSAGRGRDVLRACLESVRDHPLTAGATRVWVVDNASVDGTVDMVVQEFPSVRLVALRRNVGFGAANNLVLRQVTADHVLLLNPDTELSAGALDVALETLRADPQAAVVGVRLIRRDGSFDHAAKRSFPTVVGAIGHFSGVGRRDGAAGRLAQYRATEIAEDGRGEVDSVNGAFMLVRRSALQDVGLFDEVYGMYGEDLDLCFRFKRAGWKVVYDGGATVLHLKGVTTVVERMAGRHRGLRMNVAFHRAMGRFYRKFHSGRPLIDLLVYAALGVKLVVSVVRATVARRGLR